MQPATVFGAALPHEFPHAPQLLMSLVTSFRTIDPIFTADVPTTACAVAFSCPFCRTATV
jgi:hypothetical protein